MSATFPRVAELAELADLDARPSTRPGPSNTPENPMAHIDYERERRRKQVRRPRTSPRVLGSRTRIHAELTAQARAHGYLPTRTGADACAWCRRPVEPMVLAYRNRESGSIVHRPCLDAILRQRTT
jgi:hypothetical protein